MSRSGYHDDLTMWSMIRWRGQVASAIRGKRGQAFFRALLSALDAMPEQKLARGDLQDDSGDVCALGALGKARGVDLEQLDTHAYDELSKTFDIAEPLAREVMYENDEGHWQETPESRWRRMRAWVVSQIRTSGQR